MTEVTLNKINARKHHLETREKQEPGRDWTPEWQELAELYKSAGSRANYAYCLKRIAFYANRNQPPPAEIEDDGHHQDWQERKDIEG